MNQGKSIVDLAIELERQSTVSNDYVSDTRNIRILPDNNNLVLAGNDEHFKINKIAHNQIATFLEIPLKYYKKTRADSPALLATNVNHWLHNVVTEKSRMIRTLDGKCRAVLSNKYKRIDNNHVLEAALPVLAENKEIKIISSDITDTKLYIKALYPRIEGEVKKGDFVQSGIVISNSEVGFGALKIQPLVYRLECTNGMISNAANQFGFNKRHIGKIINADEFDYQIFCSKTIEAEDHALFLKLQDTIRAAADPDMFRDILLKMQQAAQSSQLLSPPKAVEELGKTFGLGEKEKNSVLENLIKDGDYSKWGALNAITKVANNLEDYQRSTEIEEMGGLILDMPYSEWNTLATAA